MGMGGMMDKHITSDYQEIMDAMNYDFEDGPKQETAQKVFNYLTEVISLRRCLDAIVKVNDPRFCWDISCSGCGKQSPSIAGWKNKWNGEDNEWVKDWG